MRVCPPRHTLISFAHRTRRNTQKGSAYLHVSTRIFAHTKVNNIFLHTEDTEDTERLRVLLHLRVRNYTCKYVEPIILCPSVYSVCP